MKETYYAVGRCGVPVIPPVEVGPFSTRDDAEKCAQALDKYAELWYRVEVRNEEPPETGYYIREYHLLSGERHKRSTNAYGCFATFDEAMERLVDLMKEREQNHSRDEFVYRIVRRGTKE